MPTGSPRRPVLTARSQPPHHKSETRRVAESPERIVTIYVPTLTRVDFDLFFLPEVYNFMAHTHMPVHTVVNL